MWAYNVKKILKKVGDRVYPIIDEVSKSINEQRYEIERQLINDENYPPSDYYDMNEGYITGLSSKGIEALTNQSAIVIPEDCIGITKLNNTGANYQTVIITENVKTIENTAFANLDQLKKVYITEEGAELEIGHQAFSKTALEELYISGRVTYMGYSCLMDTTNLRKLMISKEGKMLNIMQNCFGNCGVEEVLLPARVASISTTAFSRMPNVKRIVCDNREEELSVSLPIATSLPEVEEIVLRKAKPIVYNPIIVNCPKLKNVYLDFVSGTDLAGHNLMFNSNCSASDGAEVTINADFTKIGAEFSGCNLKKLTITGNVNTLYMNSFNYMPDDFKLYLKNMPEIIENGAFSGKDPNDVIVII